MSDNSLETVEAVETETKEVVQDKVDQEEVVEETTDDAKDPSKTDEEVKEQPEEKQLTDAEKKAYALEKRLHRKTAIEKQQAEELEALRKEVESLRPKQIDDAPKEDDYSTYEEWQDAVVEHKANKLLKEKELKAKQEQFQRKQQEMHMKAQKEFEDQELKFKADNPDYETNAKSFMDTAVDIQKSKGQSPTLDAIGQVLSQVDGAPALINHLGQNEDLAYELADMTPVNAAFKLFELRNELLNVAPKEEPIKPAPVKTLKGSGKTNKSLSDQDGKGVLAWVNS